MNAEQPTKPAGAVGSASAHSQGSKPEEPEAAAGPAEKVRPPNFAPKANATEKGTSEGTLSDLAKQARIKSVSISACIYPVALGRSRLLQPALCCVGSCQGHRRSGCGSGGHAAGRVGAGAPEDDRRGAVLPPDRAHRHQLRPHVPHGHTRGQRRHQGHAEVRKP